MTDLVLRCDGGGPVGLGHVTRCAALAAAARAAGARIRWLLAQAHDDVLPWIEPLGPWKALGVAPGSPADVAATAAEAADTLVVDSYAFDAAAVGEVARRAFVVAFDDTGERRLACDVVLNANVYASALGYPARVCLLGPEYACLRAAIVAARERSVFHADARRVLVTLGGAAHPATLAIVTEALGAVGGLDVRVLGPGGRVDLAEALAGADLLVSAGGTTCLEAACVGVPGLVVAVADNQRPGVAALDARGWFRSLGWAADLAPEAVRAAISGLLADVDARREMRERQRAGIDGGGAARAWAAIVAARDGVPGVRSGDLRRPS